MIFEGVCKSDKENSFKNGRESGAKTVLSDKSNANLLSTYGALSASRDSKRTPSKHKKNRNRHGRSPLGQSQHGSMPNNNNKFRSRGINRNRPQCQTTTAKSETMGQPTVNKPVQAKKGTRLVLLKVTRDDRLMEICRKASEKESKLNQKLNDWDLRGRLIALDRTNEIVLIIDDVELRARESLYLTRMFQQHNAVGFDDWLGGAKGWRYEEHPEYKLRWKTDFVVVLNGLHDVFKLFAAEDQLYIPGSKEMVWKKNQNLKGCVSDIRVWLETIAPSPLVDLLLRNSNRGPDAPVHWAHHHPESKRYPLTVVTMSSMVELANGIASLLQKEFQDDSGIPLGTRWRETKGRQSKWKTTACFKWDTNALTDLLNGTQVFEVSPSPQQYCMLIPLQNSLWNSLVKKLLHEKDALR